MTMYRNPVNVFLSYAHEDEHLVKELMNHLSLLNRQGLISTWYDRKIVPGADWTIAIDEQMERASIILLLVSPDFLASDYCYQTEMTRALERHQAGEAQVIPILGRPVDWKDAPFSQLQALPIDAKPITTWSNQDEAFVDIVAGIRRAIEDLPLLPASASRAVLPAIWTIPYPPNPFFLGRDNLLSLLHTRLRMGHVASLAQPQAITGLGGIGKTQLAVEYAYRYHQEYEVVFWARAESQEELYSSYTRIARLIKLPGHEAKEQKIIVEAVKTWLQTHNKWLLILDNADDLNLLLPFLPPAAGGHILITTRAWDLQRLATRLEVETLSDEQGALLLLRRAGLLAPDASLEQASPQEQAIAMELSKELGGLPLALDQTGAYLEATGLTLDDYYQLYQLHRRILLQQRRSYVPDHPESVATTWSLSFERVEEKNPAAADLLRFCAFLASDAIPEEVITRGAPHLGPLLGPIAADTFQLAQSIEALRAYSLISRNPRNHILSVHRLVQAVLKDSMDNLIYYQWAQRAVYAVNVAFPLVEFKSWTSCEVLLPHALACAELINNCDMEFPEAGRLLTQTGWYLKERGHFAQAEQLLTRGLEIRQRVLGPDHLEVADSLNKLGRLYHIHGRDTEAEQLLTQGLEIRQKVLGPDHLEVADSLNNLALLYFSQGNYRMAEQLFKRAYLIREKQLGSQNLQTAMSLNNLADIYRAQKRYIQAEEHYKRALQIFERILESEHPDMIYPLSGLANLYFDQKKYSMAEPLYQRALWIGEQQLGSTHPLVRSMRRKGTSFLKWMRYDRKTKTLKEDI